MGLVVFDYLCTECKHIFEVFVERSEKEDAQPCPECSSDAFAKPAVPHLDYQELAMDDANTTSVDRWEKDRYRRMAREAKLIKEHGSIK